MLQGDLPHETCIYITWNIQHRTKSTLHDYMMFADDSQMLGQCSTGTLHYLMQFNALKGNCSGGVTLDREISPWWSTEREREREKRKMKEKKYGEEMTQRPKHFSRFISMSMSQTSNLFKPHGHTSGHWWKRLWMKWSWSNAVAGWTPRLPRMWGCVVGFVSDFYHIYIYILNI